MSTVIPAAALAALAGASEAPFPPASQGDDCAKNKKATNTADTSYWNTI